MVRATPPKSLSVAHEHFTGHIVDEAPLFAAVRQSRRCSLRQKNICGYDMKISNIGAVISGFQVLQTSGKSQTAVMILDAAGKSSEAPNTHAKSDQVLLVVEGEVWAEIKGQSQKMTAGECCVIPAGTPHRFENRSGQRAVTFNVYSPPEYAPGEIDE